MSRKAHRAASVHNPFEVVKMLLEIRDIASTLPGPYQVLYRDLYDSGGGGSEVRISGGGVGDPVPDRLDSRDHAKLHAAALAITKNITEALRELDNAKSEMERSMGRSFKQPPHDRKGWVAAEDLEQAVQRRRARNAAGGEMERVQRGDT